ncbi:Protein_phosphatase PP2A regulatory subunit B [Hexamita inflata]|uniref:Serine/threonine-protein phosphatase 2A 55 kDa regulatory subunit B n=1 Tax=Hexamita inflata TaxID=28002 RepID=A0AA86UNN3_9EUKA|nr:Protein phosphatase PP2A regulatory subunit B [Hexamita inflata]
MSQMDWSFRQVFGDTCPVEQVQEPDMISSLKFSQSGQFLAAGDRGGRVIVFQRKINPQTGSKIPVEYEFYTEFQAHQQGFDAMRSVQVSEKVVQIQWLPQVGDTLYLMTCNERVVKLWRVENKRVSQVQNTNSSKGRRVADSTQLAIPRIVKSEDFQPTCVCRRVFDNVSAFHVNSISVSQEQDRFLIADDLKVSIWSVNDNQEAIEVVNLKPPKIDEACEVITYASFSPCNASQFVYGTSSGNIQLVDTRISAVQSQGRLFQNPLQSSAELPYGSFGAAANQSDIAAGICSVQLSKQSNMLIARDFLSVKLWDVRMENRPLQVIPLHPQVREYVGRFLESDAIFDRFEVAFSPDGKSFATGSYTDRFNIYSLKGQQYAGYNIQATRQVKRRSRAVLTFLQNRPSPSPNVGALPIFDGRLLQENVNMDPMEIRRKIQYLDWHPTENVLACATVSNLYVYAAQ